ncbi:MAG: Uma2 family endonuclease [Myxococcota bacterium]
MPESALPPSLAELGPPRLLSADEVLRMVAAGLLVDERVELLDGVLYAMSPQGPAHSASSVWLHQRLAARYGESFSVYDHSTFRLSDVSLPEPDLAVVRGRPLDFYARHVRPADIVLLVEISMTSQRRDRAKAALYAAGGVPVYWRVDLPTRRVELHTQPAPGGYAQLASYGADEPVPLPELGTELAFAELFRAG